MYEIMQEVNHPEAGANKWKTHCHNGRKTLLRGNVVAKSCTTLGDLMLYHHFPEDDDVFVITTVYKFEMNEDGAHINSLSSQCQILILS